MDKAVGVLPVDVGELFDLRNGYGAFKKQMRYGKVFITASGGKPQSTGKNVSVDKAAADREPSDVLI